MSRRITIAPVTRIEGHLELSIEVNEFGQVGEARASGTMFRGFESIIAGRDPRDAIHLTQRICGVCPVPHARTAVEALERAFGVQVSGNAVLLRNLVQAAGTIADHLMHFYHLALLDYVAGPGMPPFTPSGAADLRFSDAQTQVLCEHYRQALDMRRLAQSLGAIFAGKLPHVMTFAPGGVTQRPTEANVADFRAGLAQLTSFVEQVYVSDVMLLCRTYPEYLSIGAGPAHLLSFGAYPDGRGAHLFPSGRLVLGRGHDRNPHAERDHRPRNHGHPHPAVLPLTPGDVAAIEESVAHAYYDEERCRHDARPGGEQPDLDKRGAYSWVKAPRLHHEPYQVGAIARMTISGRYHGGVSVLGRLAANAYECALLANAMRGWLDELALDGSGFQQVAGQPRSGRALALTEAPRGALAHWLEYADGKVTRYRIITPTSWNASPRDERGVPGPLEQALEGVRVKDRERPIEVYRVVHSFDPCMGCAVHVTVVDSQVVAPPARA